MITHLLAPDARKGFSFLAGINRSINPAQVTKLANSINKMGTIRPVVVAKMDFISGSRETYIIDGQHLYTACLRLGIAVPYIVVDIPNIKELVETIALLNSSSKSWVLLDYIKSWQVISTDYKVLIEFFNRYDIEMSQTAEILHRGYCTTHSQGVMSKVIKGGDFKILNLLKSKQLLDKITEVLSIVPRMDRVSNKTLIHSYCNYAIHPDYNHEKTIAFMKSNRDKFLLSTNDTEEFMKIFNEIR